MFTVLAYRYQYSTSTKKKISNEQNFRTTKDGQPLYVNAATREQRSTPPEILKPPVLVGAGASGVDGVVSTAAFSSADPGDLFTGLPLAQVASPMTLLQPGSAIESEKRDSNGAALSNTTTHNVNGSISSNDTGSIASLPIPSIPIPIPSLPPAPFAPAEITRCSSLDLSSMARTPSSDSLLNGLGDLDLDQLLQSVGDASVSVSRG